MIRREPSVSDDDNRVKYSENLSTGHLGLLDGYFETRGPCVRLSQYLFIYIDDNCQNGAFRSQHL